jgi:alpha-glucoside transport system permease protein
VTADRGGGTGARFLRRLPTGRGRKALVAIAFLAPALVALGAFVVYPAIATIARSLYDRSDNDFVGLDNYQAMFELDRIRRAIRNSLVWVVAFPALVVGLGLVLAVLSERIRWQTAFKTLLFLPTAISLLASGVIWRLVYQSDPDLGALNALLDVPRSLVEPEGGFPGALPSVATADVGSDRTVSVAIEVDEDGGVARLGLLRINIDQVPAAARQAADPAPQPGAITGVVWRDITPGEDEKGVVDDGELGRA